VQLQGLEGVLSRHWIVVLLVHRCNSQVGDVYCAQLAACTGSHVPSEHICQQRAQFNKLTRVRLQLRHLDGNALNSHAQQEPACRPSNQLFALDHALNHAVMQSSWKQRMAIWYMRLDTQQACKCTADSFARSSNCTDLAARSACDVAGIARPAALGSASAKACETMHCR
jgi:hypothetical protein